MHPKRDTRGGFTLIEMMVVIIIIAVVVGVAVLRIEFMVPKYELRGAARAVAYHAKRARFRAASSGKDVYIKYDLGSGKFWMLVSFPKLEEGQELEDLEEEEIEYEYQKVMEKSLPDGVKFVNVIMGTNDVYSTGVATVRLSPFGSANHLIINLQNESGRWLSMKVNGFTGAVSFSPREKKPDEILEDGGS